MMEINDTHRIVFLLVGCVLAYFVRQYYTQDLDSIYRILMVFAVCFLSNLDLTIGFLASLLCVFVWTSIDYPVSVQHAVQAPAPPPQPARKQPPAPKIEVVPTPMMLPKSAKLEKKKEKQEPPPPTPTPTPYGDELFENGYANF